MKSIEQYELAIHEAGHAVVGHLVGVAIDHVTIIPHRGSAGHSSPVRHPVAAAADKLWAGANAISRTLTQDWSNSREKEWVYYLRKGFKRGGVMYENGRVRRWKTRGTRAPQQLVDHMEGLRKRASAMWKKANKAKTRGDRIKDLMHILGGPVADFVFFNVPFEAPRHRLVPKAELKAMGLSEAHYGYTGQTIGNYGAGTDFRLMREALKDIDNANWKDARELYRGKAEKLVRRHKATIEHVAKALLRRKTLNGAELAKLIRNRCMSDPIGRPPMS